MKKQGLLILIMIFIFQKNTFSDYIVISNQQILEGENIDHVQSVASISKVMTALVALENGDITDEVIITKEMSEQIGSSLYLQENERYSLLSLIYGLMLRSGNDAAYAISCHVSKNNEAFVALMNEKAKKLGMKNTIFSNPSGLDEEDGGNQSTVYDMALCMQAAMKNEVFRMIVQTKQYKAENQRVWINKNRLLKTYEYCNGGKTGYTVKAGKTLITSASYQGLESIVVSFREDDYFMLHQRLHEKINETYQSVLLVPKGIYQINHRQIYIEEDIRVLVQDNESIEIKTLKKNHEIVIKYKELGQEIERKVTLYDSVLE